VSKTNIQVPTTRHGTPALMGLIALMAVVSGSLLVSGCSDQPGEPGTTVHDKTWSDPGSEDFHGEFVAKQGAGSCKRCHEPHDDANNCNKCHAGPGGHPAGWADPDQHGAEVLDDGTGECKRCHGGNLRGGWSEVSCYACHDGPDGGGGDGGGGGGSVHPTGWSDGRVHGAEVMANSATSCTACHGSDYMGGTSGVSCYTCHDGPGGHPTGWSRPSVHGAEVRANGSESCALCHGADYRGGWTGVSCYRCHNGPNG
jgi:hypothetical protein